MSDHDAPEVGSALSEAIRAGLRKCRVEDGSPVALLRDGDLHHITYMVAVEVERILAARDAEHAAEVAERDARLAKVEAKAKALCGGASAHGPHPMPCDSGCQPEWHDDSCAIYGTCPGFGPAALANPDGGGQ